MGANMLPLIVIKRLLQWLLSRPVCTQPPSTLGSGITRGASWTPWFQTPTRRTGILQPMHFLSRPVVETLDHWMTAQISGTCNPPTSLASRQGNAGEVKLAQCLQTSVEKTMLAPNHQGVAAAWVWGLTHTALVPQPWEMCCETCGCEATTKVFAVCTKSPNSELPTITFTPFLKLKSPAYHHSLCILCSVVHPPCPPSPSPDTPGLRTTCFAMWWWQRMSETACLCKQW